jgi:hypothetical protein
VVGCRTICRRSWLSRSRRPRRGGKLERAGCAPGVSNLCGSILTEIYLCHTCSCHETLRMETPGQGEAPARGVGAGAALWHARRLDSHGHLPARHVCLAVVLSKSRLDNGWLRPDIMCIGLRLRLCGGARRRWCTRRHGGSGCWLHRWRPCRVSGSSGGVVEAPCSPFGRDCQRPRHPQ